MKDQVLDFMDSLENEDRTLKEFVDSYEPLSEFVTKYEFLARKNKLTQKEIAKAMGTTQSAVSRIVSLKTNPSYKQLLKLSNVVNGKLYITPMGDMTVTVPVDLQEKVKAVADSEGVSVRDFLFKEIRKNVNIQYDSLEKENLENSNSFETKILDFVDGYELNNEKSYLETDSLAAYAARISQRRS